MSLSTQPSSSYPTTASRLCSCPCPTPHTRHHPRTSQGTCAKRQAGHVPSAQNLCWPPKPRGSSSVLYHGPHALCDPGLLSTPTPQPLPRCLTHRACPNLRAFALAAHPAWMAALILTRPTSPVVCVLPQMWPLERLFQLPSLPELTSVFTQMPVPCPFSADITTGLCLPVPC